MLLQYVFSELFKGKSSTVVCNMAVTGVRFWAQWDGINKFTTRLFIDTLAANFTLWPEQRNIWFVFWPCIINVGKVNMEHQLDARITFLLISKISSTCFGHVELILEINKTVIVASSWCSIFTLPKETLSDYLSGCKGNTILESNSETSIELNILYLRPGCV
jgi:hypothetical protein